MKIHIEYDDFGEYVEILGEDGFEVFSEISSDFPVLAAGAVKKGLTRTA